MAHLRVAGRAMICEDFMHNGQNYKNMSGQVLMITRKIVTLQIGKETLHVPKDKVVAK